MHERLRGPRCGPQHPGLGPGGQTMHLDDRADPDRPKHADDRWVLVLGEMPEADARLRLGAREAAKDHCTDGAHRERVLLPRLQEADRLSLLEARDERGDQTGPSRKWI